MCVLSGTGGLVDEAIRSGVGRLLGRGVLGRVLVGVSGGADSVALLSGLLAVGIEVGVGHLDHGTREGQSAVDAEWVRELAEKMGVRCFVKAVDVPGMAAELPESFEEVARGVRYDFLAEVAAAEGYGVIATGHHGDDQVETVLMRVVRGTSPTGLAGIPEIGEWKGVRVIRPLLGVSRSAIEGYLRDAGLDYLEDSSNADPKYVRNRVRHELLPLLREEFNPQIDSALRHLAVLSGDEDDFLGGLVTETMGRCVAGEGMIDREGFRGEHRAVQRRILVRLAHRVGGAGDFSIVDGAVDFVVSGESGSHYDFGNGVSLSNGRDETLVVRKDFGGDASVRVLVPGTALFAGHGFEFIELESLPDEPLKDFCGAGRQVVDADVLGGEVVLRHREDGDRIQPFGMTGTRKVKDYFGDLGIPLEMRDRVPIVACGSEIVWIVGYAVSGKFAVGETTRRGLLIEVSDGIE